MRNTDVEYFYDRPRNARGVVHVYTGGTRWQDGPAGPSGGRLGLEGVGAVLKLASIVVVRCGLVAFR